MGTAEERMRILKMLEDGTITADEATNLLQALSKSRAGDGGGQTVPEREARWLRVRITDMNTRESKVNINIPMGLVRTGIRMGMRFVPSDSDVDYHEIMDAINSGATGKIFEMTDEEQGEHIEIWAE